MAWLQVVIDRDALVKNKAFPAPAALGFGHGFQVLENATFEVINLVKTLGAHEGCGFFAANAARTKHGDFGFFAAAVLQPTFRSHFTANPIWQFRKTAGSGVDRACKSANRDFIVIARVDQHHVWVADEGVPVLRLDILAGHAVRVDAFHAHRYDFLLESHLHPVKGGFVTVGFFVFQRGQAWVSPQMG